MLSLSAWVNGIYTAEALKSTVGNMLSKKGTKQYQYPQKPVDLVENQSKKEKEAQKQRDLFVAKMEILKANFELNKLNK